MMESAVTEEHSGSCSSIHKTVSLSAHFYFNDMEKFEIIEHVPDKRESGNEFLIVAIDFREPKYVRMSSRELLNKGEIVEIEGDNVY
jgi:hypothetical protein